MKIGQDIRSQMDPQKRPPSPDHKQPFKQVMQSQTATIQQNQLHHLMQNIQTQGNTLARFRTIREVVKFKRLVKRFLEEAVKQGLDVERTHHFQMGGAPRELTLVKAIDEKLVELTEVVLSEEEQTIDLLGLIGEIKGLLVNLYT